MDFTGPATLMFLIRADRIGVTAGVGSTCAATDHPMRKHRMAAKALPSPDELRKLLDYDPETGALTWKPRPASMFVSCGSGANKAAAHWNARHAGRPALNCANTGGYFVGSLLDVRVYAHRVAWALHFGQWPSDQIDHINGRRDDNRIANLRAVSNAVNQRNTKLPITNTSGAIGVVWHKASGKWQARIREGGRQNHLGLFADFDSAVSSRKAAEREFGYHENHGRSA